MKAFVAVLALASAASAQIISPYAGYTGYAGLPGLPYAGYAGLPLTTGPYTYASGYAPATIAAPAFAAPAIAPVVAAPAAVPSSQFHSQDEFGNVAHGYSNINSAKQESGNTYGGVQGSYSYVDANNQVQTTNYVADALGFRVTATNLPVAPVADLLQPIHTLVGPEPVKDTKEVMEAKAAFKAAFDEAASRTKRSTPAATTPLAIAAPAPLTYGLPWNYAAAPAAWNYAAAPAAWNYAAAPAYNYAPTWNYAAAPALTYAAAPAPALTYAAAPAAAVVASAPAAREATLTKIQNNPGFATSYRVD